MSAVTGKEKIVNVRGLEVKVNELRYQGVKFLVGKIKDAQEGLSAERFLDSFEEALPHFCDLNKEKLMKENPYVSELLEIYEAFKEVNASFFLTLKKMGMGLGVNAATDESKSKTK